MGQKLTFSQFASTPNLEKIIQMSLIKYKPPTDLEYYLKLFRKVEEEKLDDTENTENQVFTPPEPPGDNVKRKAHITSEHAKAGNVGIGSGDARSPDNAASKNVPQPSAPDIGPRIPEDNEETVPRNPILSGPTSSLSSVSDVIGEQAINQESRPSGCTLSDHLESGRKHRKRDPSARSSEQSRSKDRPSLSRRHASWGHVIGER